MKSKYIALLSIVFLIGAVTIKATEQPATINTLISYMEGSFSSEEQAKADEEFRHITLDMKRIWPKETDGAWLYVEQTAAWTPGKPYRQRVYHLQELSPNTFSSTIYKISNQKDFVGGHLKPELFDSISKADLTLLEGCTVNMTYENKTFKGQTVVGACKSSWGKADYATSEVEITPGLLHSWDRGWNNQKEQVWGAVKGGYKFLRIKK